MNEDKYFERKAKDLAEMINTEIQFNTSWEKIIEKTGVFLKEVARDQRYACSEAYLKNLYSESYLIPSTDFPESYKHSLYGIIQNAMIKGE